ncbi:23S rRNA (adenine(2503)-C(2))-methyltransferase RlmN [Alicyclobacillus cycloheptanicus]|uniref:Probable dual-specificity RNA methyltransferase RlmN n=1 Tax=Alicyclobacillus cycloheptanicus TaxID=1457 RepID=A0ABT9XKL3_9BACL|nr:23S rRNA (adenine(2503)-C(2))-methyltransferase RlmN [Alicyclobacillus cycloheptanicus]MDQ0190840.1 23S rRNA (adenine2503-C2)-methyltransferase [Alicyclobacillus cycloheptanicus]WDM01460.1 23S rRNA (adenine(2503)-C(2))-methyltransferase RlmN [Alicyclobacillus cycloheptanicus]
MHHLYNFRKRELIDLLKTYGEPSYRATQIFEWLYQKRATRISEMTNLSKKLRQRLEEEATVVTSEALRKQVSKVDGTVKFLLGWSDHVTVETVLMRHDYGNSVCVSTQVGCKMGCTFCASTLGGMIRQMTAGEMVEQLLWSQRLLDDTDERVSSVVLMGSGEPMDNYEQAMKFIDIINDPNGLNIGQRHITISTVGLVPGIIRLADDGRPITLAVSLHAANDELRSSMMPVNRAYPLEKLMEACQYYCQKTGRRISFEYALVGGKNDSLEDARQLAALIRNLPSHVNLIPVNYVPERNYSRTPKDQIDAFLQELRRLGVNATIRREMGHDISAACGQLRAEHAELV